MRTSWGVAALVAGTSVLAAPPAAADPIALTAGVIDVAVSSAGSFAGGFQLSGDRGFTFVGPIAGGFASPPLGGPLPPGATITVQGSACCVDVGGTATLDGVTYTAVGGLDSIAGAVFRLTTQITLPAVLSPPSSVTAPFALDVLFGVFGQQDYALSGSGTATIFLAEDRGFEIPSWGITRVRAELSGPPPPVPEPATVLLAGSGLAWMIRRRRPTRRLSGPALR